MAEFSVLELSVADCPLVQLDAWDGKMQQFQSNLMLTSGIVLPDAVGETIRQQDDLLAIKIAPRRFWLLCGVVRTRPIAVDPQLGSVVDLSEGRVKIRLAGARLADTLAGCIAVDWRSPAAAPGKAIQTPFHHVPVLYVRTGEMECDLIVPRSFAGSILDWLEDGAGRARTN